MAKKVDLWGKIFEFLQMIPGDPIRSVLDVEN